MNAAAEGVRVMCSKELGRPAIMAVTHVQGHQNGKLRRWHRRQISGYWAFGYDVGDNILQTVGHPTWLIVMANLMVVRARDSADSEHVSQSKQLPVLF